MNSSRVLGLSMIASLLAFPASARADNIFERIAVAVLAEKFGMDTREVIVLQEQSRLPIYELAPIFEGSYYFLQRPTTIMQLREQGLGWGQIAQRVGMHPGQFNKLRNQGAFDRDRFWATSYRDRFGTPESQIVVVRQRGGSLEDVLASIIVGKLTNKPPQDIYARYMTERSWATVARVHDVRFEQWSRVSSPVRVRYVIEAPKQKPQPVAKHRGSSKAKDVAKSKGKSQGKGKGKGKGG